MKYQTIANNLNKFGRVLKSMSKLSTNFLSRQAIRLGGDAGEFPPAKFFLSPWKFHEHLAQRQNS